jgi:hypothetical protein
MAANKPGDGKSSPFGNGKGGSGMARSAPNNFAKNPKGSSSGAPKPRNLVADGGKPTSTGEEPNPDSEVAGGLIPLADSKDPDATHPVGKNSRKPYKLGS